MSRQPLKRESDICQLLSCIPERFVVDFANGIDVSRDHLAVQRQPRNIFNRLLDGVSGKAARRQSEINANLIEGLDASLAWLMELTGSLAQSNLAIARVNDRVSDLKLDVAKIAGHSIQLRNDVDRLSEHLITRCSLLEKEVARVDFVQRVEQNLSEVFQKWQAGLFQSFSPAARCFVAMEELRWGAFGDFCRSQSGGERQRLIDRAVIAAMAQLRIDMSCEISERLVFSQWLKYPAAGRPLIDTKDALLYLSDDYSLDDNPFVLVATQDVSELPLQVPRIANAARLTEAIAEEVFERDVHG